MASTSRKALKLLKRGFSSRDSGKDDIKVFTYDATKLEVHQLVYYREEEFTEVQNLSCALIRVYYIQWQFDTLLISSWEKARDQGVLRYKLPESNFSVLPGMYGYMVQVLTSCKYLIANV